MMLVGASDVDRIRQTSAPSTYQVVPDGSMAAAYVCQSAVGSKDGGAGRRAPDAGPGREGRGICTSGTALEREEQVPDAVVEGGGDQLGWPGRPQVGQPRVQLAEQHAHLLPGQGGAEAEVRPTAAEPDVRVGPAGDVEPVRVGEYG